MDKTLGDKLREVLNQAVELANYMYIKTRPVKSRFFEQLCSNMDPQHRRLLLHTEVRWLSKGKVLNHVYELRQELLKFFEEMKQNHFCELLRCEAWISKLAYLADIFQHLNILNVTMQGSEENILTAIDKMKAFQKNYLSGRERLLIVIWKCFL